MIRYEHPLNERVRTLMRLEDLFARVGYFASQDAAPDHHSALLALFEITDVAARADLKTDILQELERQKQVLAPLKHNPKIEQDALEELLAQIDHVNAQMLAQAGRVGSHLRDNEWLMAIKQRTASPGGVCEFDLPAYHWWLNQDPGPRRNDLASWTACVAGALTETDYADKLRAAGFREVRVEPKGGPDTPVVNLYSGYISAEK